MKLSKLSHAVIAATLMTAGAMAHAEITTSGSVAITSDYKFRGITQTSNNAAIQGSFSAEHDSGAYATVWASSIDSLAPGSSGSEIDLMLGYAGEIGEVGYDVGVMRYGYPGANKGNYGADPDFNELYASFSMGGASLGLAYSDDYFGETGKYSYVSLGYGTEVKGYGLSASVGYNKLYDSGQFFAATDDDYIDYTLAVSKEVSGIGFELAYIGTDIDESDYSGFDIEGSFVISASKSF